MPCAGLHVTGPMGTEYLTGAALDAAQEVTGRLARTMGAQHAAHMVHSAALVQHAATVGLISPVGDLPRDLDRLTALHPALAAFCDPAVNHAYGDSAPREVTELWNGHSIADHRSRPDGYRLGNLYQQLSEEARNRRALCQTPGYVSDLLLDLAFDRAYEARGPRIQMIDPACGTGHILVETLIRAHTRQQLGLCRSSRHDSPRLPTFTPPLKRIHAALDTLHGVDLDPYAAAVAAYRLLVMARGILRGDEHPVTATDLARLPLHVATADTLLDEHEPLLARGRYDVVIANPPYISCKDPAARTTIRARYPQVCQGRYSLALPFHALMTELLNPGGWCAQLTSNAFMKREFGRRYVEEFLTRLDLYWVIDSSGAYLPGHGTPTVILANRNQPPSSATVPTVHGVRGEPRTPKDPAKGLVWRAIVEAVRAHEAYAGLGAALDRHRHVSSPAGTEPLPAGTSTATAPLPDITQSTFNRSTFTQPTLFDLLPEEGAA